MKIFRLFFLGCVILFAQTTQAQFEQYDLTKRPQTDKPVRIFVTALWCDPCMRKYKELLHEFQTDTLHHNLIVFDVLGFTYEKLRKIEPQQYDSSKCFFMPRSFYRLKSLLVINGAQKALERFLAGLARLYQSNYRFPKFGYGNMIAISKDGQLSHEEYPVKEDK